jgi:hypothetical protein
MRGWFYEECRAPLVAEDVRGIAMVQLDNTARRLLREMGYQAEGNPARDILPREAAENLGLAPSSLEYQAALNHLIALGDVERKAPNTRMAPPDPDLLGQDLYRLTRQGFRRVRDLRWGQ